MLARNLISFSTGTGQINLREGYFRPSMKPDPAHAQRRQGSGGAGELTNTVTRQRPFAADQKVVEDRIRRLKEKHQSLDDLAAAVGIPLRKKADVGTIVPIAPKVRKVIAPLVPPASKPQTRPVFNQVPRGDSHADRQQRPSI